MKKLFAETPTRIWIALAILLALSIPVISQVQTSGSPPVAITSIAAGANLIGKTGIDQTTPGTTNAVALSTLGATAVDTNNGNKSAGTLRVTLATDQVQLTNALKVDGTGGAFPISGNIGNTAFGINAGTANVGFFRALPSSCTQSTNFSNATAQVATGAGTTVTSTTTCVTFAYANNITNSSVTLRLADKAGTPVIWLGGNADFTILANSNIRIPIDGVLFTSGITAIAGTAAAINLQINGVQ